MDEASSRATQLADALEDLLRVAPEIEGVAITTFDGLPMATALPRSLEEDRVAAVSAALLALGEQASDALGRGQLTQVLLESDQGAVHLMAARDRAVLLAVVGPDAKIGMVRFEMRRTAGRVADALEDPVDIRAGATAAEES